jgi:hypothetical protein
MAGAFAKSGKTVLGKWEDALAFQVNGDDDHTGTEALYSIA